MRTAQRDVLEAMDEGEILTVYTIAARLKRDYRAVHKDIGKLVHNDILANVGTAPAKKGGGSPRALYAYATGEE
ncbi:MAG: hypothetical protein WBK88_07115 [Methanothrix sp.]